MGWLDEAILAPARAMMAQPQETPESLGVLGQIHDYIDPVRAFGGYGNMAAMALPMGKSPPGSRPRLVVSAKLPDGTVRVGKPGQIHWDLVSDLPMDDLAKVKMGFTVPDGGAPFLTREQAARLANEHPSLVKPEKLDRLPLGLDATWLK